MSAWMFSSRREAKSDRDYTKTLTYVSIDLAARILSSIALVALGVAGWRLQARTEETRRMDEQRAAEVRRESDVAERQQRRYLPMLRSLTELEAALRSARLDLQLLKQDDPNLDIIYLRVGTRLRHVASSVFLAEADPTVAIRKADIWDLSIRNPETVELPLRAAAIMLADMLAMRRIYEKYPSLDETQLIGQASILRVGKVGTRITPQALPAWKALLAAEGDVTTGMLKRIRHAQALEALSTAAAEVIQNLISKNPELGDRYVQIRTDVLRDAPRMRADVNQ